MYFQSPSGCEYLLITPDRSLVFPSVEYVRNVVSKAGMKQGSSSVPVVIDSRHIQGADFTAAKVSNTCTGTVEDFSFLQCRLKMVFLLFIMKI
jgi:sodium-independent sulfate anion transporter 11